MNLSFRFLYLLETVEKVQTGVKEDSQHDVSKKKKAYKI